MEVVKSELVTNKKWYTSKTMWLSFVMALSGILYQAVPATKEYLTEANILLVFSFLGFIIRIITKGKVEF